MKAKARAEALKDVRFENPRLQRVGVEVMSLAQLREKAGAALGAHERVEFLMLLFVQAGRGIHRVDFEQHPAHAGTVLIVRPGQVQQWRLSPSLEGQLILVSPDALLPAVARGNAGVNLLALEDWSTAFRPGRAQFAEALADVRRLRADLARFAGSDVECAMIRYGFMTLLLRLARDRMSMEPVTPGSREAQVHRLFVRELETGLRERWSVLDYAKRIGYSESTLSRACVAVTGLTAKQVLDRRVALEAQRWLAHSDESVVQIGHRLGFSEPTNFVKFFRRLVGVTPVGFREGAR